MKKLEIITFSIGIVFIFTLQYLPTDSYSAFVVYTMIIIYMGTLIAPEVEPKYFQFPRFYQFSVGALSGILFASVSHVNTQSFIAIISISIAIGVLTPFWYKLLDYGAFL
jgi:uncharacterized membrane protein YccC